MVSVYACIYLCVYAHVCVCVFVFAMPVCVWIFMCVCIKVRWLEKMKWVSTVNSYSKCVYKKKRGMSWGSRCVLYGFKEERDVSAIYMCSIGF